MKAVMTLLNQGRIPVVVGNCSQPCIFVSYVRFLMPFPGTVPIIARISHIRLLEYTYSF